MVAATAVDRNAPTRFSDADSATATFGLEGAAGDRGGHRVAGVVEAVREVEGERGDHHDDQEEKLKVHGENCRRYLRPGVKPMAKEFAGARAEWSANVRLPLTSGVAAQRVIVGNLHENQCDAVGIGDVHLVQTPRFRARLAGDRTRRGDSSSASAA